MSGSRFAGFGPAALTVIAAILLLVSGLGEGLRATYDGLWSPETLARVSAAASGLRVDAQPVTVAAIDTETFEAWGRRETTPHGALAELISLAGEAPAAALLVDIDLSGAGPPDPDLLGVLMGYSANAPLLMIARAIRFDRAATASAPATPYDAAVAARPNIAWVSTVPEPGSDRAVRRIRLWQSLCAASPPVFLPSPALLMAAKRVGAADLGGFASAMLASDCAGAEFSHRGWPPLGPADRSAAIAFTIWGNGEPIGPAAAGGVDLVRLAPAWTLVMPGEGGRFRRPAAVSPTLFSGRIAVIGVTHGESRDIHATPVGQMAGVLILANTMATATALALPRGGAVTLLVVSVLLFGAFALLSAWFQSALAAPLSAAVALVTITIYSRQFGFGGAIDMVAAAITLFAVYRLSESAATIISRWRAGLGLRAFMKSTPEPDDEP